MPDHPPLTLATPIMYAKGVGEVRARELATLGVQTCGDLLFHFPRDYLQYADEAPMDTMKVGEVATVRGTILQTRMIAFGRRRFEALLEDAAVPVSKAASRRRCVLTWFNAWGLDQKIQPGMLLRVTGKVTLFRERLQMVQPKWEELSGEEKSIKRARIEPVYPATMELSSAVIARIVGAVLETVVSQIPEFFTAEFLRERSLFTRREALLKIHQPATLKEATAARRTLAYHEFFVHQAAMAIKRYHQRNSAPAISLRVDDAVDRRIRALLPFSLTRAQERVIESIRKDLNAAKPMNRLLQGDVGSGKTVVALYAMLAATATRRSAESSVLSAESKGAGAAQDSGLRTQNFSGHQAALMAPTEILAEQHFITMSKLLEGKKVKIALLTGSVIGKERTATLREIAEGSVGLVVGTHALLSEAVRFKALAMVVIDEQHKFGVEQRSLIRMKPSQGPAQNSELRTQNSASPVAPHMLVMTATPIPRTLAMTTFGDLDVSVIDELPPGRQGVFTKMTPTSNREQVYRWVAGRLKAGEQAYVVVPAIDESELELRTVSGVQEELQKEWLKDFRVGLIHGRMNRDTRQHIMERFRQHLIDVLVATTVIEVGVDVAKATVMVIEHADRFGLSQLHQLRGRVGRGSKQSHCILLGDQTTEDAIARLQAMVKYSSGFDISEQDLKLRGMGHIIGTAQSGRTDLHFAELLFDPQLLPLSRRDAFNLVAADPRLLDPSHMQLRKDILERFADSITLADVG